MTRTALDLFGTAEPVPERRRLRAGPLSLVLEAGQLRDLRWHGAEAVRGIAYLLRDAAWGTVPLALSEPEVTEGESTFAVAFVGRAEGASGRLSLRATIRGEAGGDEGWLAFEVTATAEMDLLANRLGFVLLHPDDVAGRPLRVGHADGSVEATAFPLRISPDQPAFDIVSLEHEPAPGVAARLSMEGGVWEMEDQRNWADASFKTYVRPLAWPRPYRVPAGSIDRQRVELRLSGRPTERAGRATVAEREPPAGRVPPVYLRLDERLPIPEALPAPVRPRGLILRMRVAAPDPERLERAMALAARYGVALAVEAVFPQLDPGAEAAALLAALAGTPVGTLLVTAERDFVTRPSNTVPPGEAPLDATLAALRAGGFASPIGAGTPAFFTEFNRNPPPPADLAFFGVTSIVHAADDRSVMETLGVLPAIMASAAALRPGVPLWPGPLALAPTVSPYGPGPAETDGTSRTCMARRDPRHGALFGAAHLLGALAAVLPGAAAVASLHVNGPTGLAAEDGSPHPLAFVLAEVAAAEGAHLMPAPAAPGLAGLAWERDGRRTVLLANLSPDALEVPRPSGLEEAHGLAPGAGGWEAAALAGPALRLGPYETMRLRGGA